MSQRPAPPSNIRAAIEKQLVAEEAWLMETLKLIKQQRNALRLERIQLEKKRQLLQNINVQDLIAERQSLLKQEGNVSLVSATSSLAEEASRSTCSTPEVKMFQGDAQGTSGILKMEVDTCNDMDLNLNPDLAMPSCSTSYAGPELSENGNEPLDIKTEFKYEAN